MNAVPRLYAWTDLPGLTVGGSDSYRRDSEHRIEALFGLPPRLKWQPPEVRVGHVWGAKGAMAAVTITRCGVIVHHDRLSQN